MADPAKASQAMIIFYMAFNFISSVSIITINKIVFKSYEYNYSTWLTCLHFITTFIGLYICSVFGAFTIKYVRIREILPLSLTFVGFVVFNNLSLQYNSIGFYQLMKVLTTPVILIVQYLLYNVSVNNKLKLTLIPICIGVTLATVSDVELNLYGTIYAILGILSTSLYQIYVKTKQQDLGLDSYQLLFLQAPTSAILVLILSLIFEPWLPSTDSNIVTITTYNYTTESIIMLSISCILAFLINLSIFLVIGKTSPIAYNVLGHFKLCVILISGFILFHEQPNLLKVIGTVLAFIGVVLYTHVQQNIPKQAAGSWDARDKQVNEHKEQQQQQKNGNTYTQLTTVDSKEENETKV